MLEKNEQLRPIHKFNGGIGATICNRCNIIIETGFSKKYIVISVLII
jgi:hypothetical protein